MIAFQFPTQVTSDGDLALPHQYRQSIPPGSTLQVVLLVDMSRQIAPLDSPHEEVPSLEAYVNSLQQRPLPHTLVSRASDLLSEHLMHPSYPADPDLDEVKWNAQWDQLETRLDADEWAAEQSRLKEIQQDLA